MVNLPERAGSLAGAVGSAVAGAVGGGVGALAKLPARAHATIPTWAEIGADPVLMRRVMNLWPPFLFAGIRVVEIRPEFRGATVELKLHALSRNYMGTQFGGSMFSMTDPFWVVLLINRLGPGYVVWDKRAEVEYFTPGRTHVRSSFEVTDEMVEEIRDAAAGGERVLRWVSNDIVDDHGTVVAHIRREIYVRRAPDAQSAGDRAAVTTPPTPDEAAAAADPDVDPVAAVLAAH